MTLAAEVKTGPPSGQQELRQSNVIDFAHRVLDAISWVFIALAYNDLDRMP